MACVNINMITLDQPSYCLNCKTYSGNGTSLKIQGLNDDNYDQLQEQGWRKSGQMFYHTNEKSCCQQEVCKQLICDYVQSNRLKRALRKLTCQDKQQQSPYSNLLQYIEQTNPSKANSQQAFEDFLTQLSQRLPSTSFDASGFKLHPLDVLKCQVSALNQEMNLNIKVDNRHILHFRWPCKFMQSLNHQNKHLLNVIISEGNYDQDAHNFYNQNYFNVTQQIYEKSFCNSNFKMIKYFIDNKIIAISFVELTSTSLHRIAFHYKKGETTEINRIAQNCEIQMAKEYNLKNYFWVKYSKKQFTIKNQVPITEDFIIHCGTKSIAIKYLKSSYKLYLIKLLNQLSLLLSYELIKSFIFKYS